MIAAALMTRISHMSIPVPKLRAFMFGYFIVKTHVKVTRYVCTLGNYKDRISNSFLRSPERKVPMRAHCPPYCLNS